MDFEALANAIADQFVIAWNAPIPFFAALLLGWFLLRLWERYRVSKQIENLQSENSALRERIQLRDDRAAEYERKLHGATPDQAREQIEALRDEIEALKPKQRTLSPEQRETIIEVAAGMNSEGSRIEIVYGHTSHESAVFASQIADALQAAGWDVHPDSLIIGTGRLTKRGLTLAVHNMRKLSPMTVALGDALHQAGIPFQWEETPGLESSGRLYVDLAD